MVHATHGPVLVELDVQTLRVKVLGDQSARLDDAGGAGEVFLAEALVPGGSAAPRSATWLAKTLCWPTYRLSGRAICQRLAEKLVCPFLGLVGGLRGQSGDYKRHDARLLFPA